MTLTYDLDSQSSAKYGHGHTHAKYRVKGQMVQRLTHTSVPRQFGP